jgi:hypothetical protein
VATRYARATVFHARDRVSRASIALPIRAIGRRIPARLERGGIRRRAEGVASLQEGGEIERSIAEFTRGSNGGLIVTASQFGANHPSLIAQLALRYKRPVVYPFRCFAASGGLIFYGPDFVGQFRQAAG